MFKKSLEALKPERLSARIAVLMTLAMLPIGLISVYQTRVVVDEAQSARNAARVAEISTTVAETRKLIFHALGAASGLAAAIEDQDVATCSATMAQFVKTNGPYVFSGFVDSNGIMNCNSVGTEADLSENPGFLEAMQNRKDRVAVSARGAISGRPVIIVSHPLFREEELLGFVSLSLPLELGAQRSIAEANPEVDTILVSMAANNNIISANVDLEKARELMPSVSDMAMIKANPEQTFLLPARNGEMRNYAVSSTVNGAVNIMGTWPQESALRGSSGAQIVLALAFPILMWIVGVGVALFGLQRVVVRHIKSLRSAMRQFALGQRSNERLQLDDPPEEIEEVQRAFNRMSMIIADSEEQQAKDLRDKEVLLREVHHRVKNNLQLIASIMNMQARQTKSDEAKATLHSLQRRVRGLATLHRTLYATPDMITVDSADLVRAVLDDTSHMVPGNQIRIRSDLESAALYPDQAVPLSMITAEALTNAFKHASSTNGEPAIVQITLTVDDENLATLTVLNSLPEGRTLADEIGSDGLGARLMNAFVSQLDGTRMVDVGSDYYKTTVSFVVRDFDQSGGAEHAK